jgi:hypothetical protein
MSLQFFGILPYDSTDSSILLKSSLTSAGSVSAPSIGSAGTVVGTGHTFDSVLGFKAATSGNSGIYFQNLTGYAALDAAGQISFEIEKAIVGSYSPTYASEGTTPSTQWTLTWGDGSAVQANITAANTEISALPAWFDTTYSSRSGDLVVADVFNAWGGMGTNANVQIGQMLGTSTNLHPSPLGNLRIAREVVNKVVL